MVERDVNFAKLSLKESKVAAVSFPHTHSLLYSFFLYVRACVLYIAFIIGECCCVSELFQAPPSVSTGREFEIKHKWSFALQLYWNISRST